MFINKSTQPFVASFTVVLGFYDIASFIINLKTVSFEPAVGVDEACQSVYGITIIRFGLVDDEFEFVIEREWSLEEALGDELGQVEGLGGGPVSVFFDKLSVGVSILEFKN